MPRKKPAPTPRASKPPAQVTVSAEYDEDKDLFRGIVTGPVKGSDKTGELYRSSKQFADEYDAVEEASSWCQDRGIQFTPL